MLSYVAAIILLVCAAAVTGDKVNRDIEIKDAPYHVTIELDDSPVTDGALLTPQWVVVNGRSITWFTDDDWANHVQVRAGSNKRSEGGSILKPKNHIYHPLFEKNSYDYNVALIQLDGTFTTGGNVAVATLGTAAPAVGSQVFVTGFGSLPDEQSTPDILQRFNVSTIARTACKIAYQDYLNDIPDRIICAGMPDGKVCYGESGETVTQNGSLIALYATALGCDRDGMPALFTNLIQSEIKTFIQSNIGLA